MNKILCHRCQLESPGERILVRCRSERCSHTLDHHGGRGPRYMKPQDAGMWPLWRRLMRMGPDLEKPCPFCQEVERLELACPRCRRSLVPESTSSRSRMIAVIGSNAAGKSHYMATVLHHFLEVGVKGWKFEMREEALARCRRDLLDPLFQDRQELPATRAVLGPDFPLQIEHEATGERTMLVFRDVGGEALLSPERLREMDFLHFADGVVLMVDPLAFQPPVDAPPEWVPHGKAPVTTALEIYQNVLLQRRRLPQDRERSLLPQQKFLAVVVTKADLVVPDTHWFWQPNGQPISHEEGFWEAREMESEAVSAWISNNLDLRIPRLTREFADVSYFFVSSFGYRHEPGQQPRQPLNPLRVQEPIFALLDRLGATSEEIETMDEAD